MVLRKLSERLRAHDWVGVGIELLVVVIGVFIGLQASNWNQDRQDDTRGVEYLQRFNGELQTEIDLLRRTTAFHQQVAEYGAGAMAYADEGKLVDGSAWKTLLAYYQASQIWPFRQGNATFQEVLSSGELRLIRNAALRSRISQHYGDSAGSRAMEVIGVVPRYREHVRSMTPWPVQKYIWSRCYASDSNIGQYLLDCASPISEAEASAVIERYRQDAALSGELRFWLATVDTSKIILNVVQAEAETLQRDIRAELAR